MGALFTIVMIWKQPKYLSTDEWIKKMWCDYIYIYDEILLSHGKEWNFALDSNMDGFGNGTPLQYSCLENPMDGEAW